MDTYGYIYIYYIYIYTIFIYIYILFIYIYIYIWIHGLLNREYQWIDSGCCKVIICGEAHASMGHGWSLYVRWSLKVLNTIIDCRFPSVAKRNKCYVNNATTANLWYYPILSQFMLWLATWIHQDAIGGGLTLEAEPQRNKEKVVRILWITTERWKW